MCVVLFAVMNIPLPCSKWHELHFLATFLPPPRRWLRNYNRESRRERERSPLQPPQAAPLHWHCSHTTMPRMLSTCWHHFSLCMSKRVADPEINAVLHMLHAPCSMLYSYLLAQLCSVCVCVSLCVVYRLGAWNVLSSAVEIGPTAAVDQLPLYPRKCGQRAICTSPKFDMWRI